MLSDHMFKRVRKLIAEGKSDRAIAKLLKLDRKTVKKYRESNTPPEYPRRVRESRADPLADHMETIERLLAAIEDLPAADVYLTLKEEHGFTGGLRTVQRRVAELKGARPKERFHEQEYEPAEQAQFDFKERIEVPFVGGVLVICLHFSTLPYSDHFAIRAYPSTNYECYMDGIHRFFESIGGLTENIRIDNLSAAVKKVLKGADRIYTDSFAKAIDYYDFGVLPCTPGKGSEKGDVEREIRTHAKRLLNRIKLKEKVFRDFDDLNEWLRCYCELYQTAKTKLLLAEEKTRLKPLPAYRETIVCKVEVTSPTLFGTVRIARSTYSVPDNMIGVPCRIVLGPYDVKIYRAGGKRELVATHPRKPDNDSSILMEHVLPSLLRKPRAMIRWAHREILFPNPIFKRFYARLRETAQRPGDAEREFLKTVNLIHYTTLAEIATGIEIVMESGPLSFDAIRDLVLTDGHRPPTSSDPRLNQVRLTLGVAAGGIGMGVAPFIIQMILECLGAQARGERKAL